MNASYRLDREMDEAMARDRDDGHPYASAPPSRRSVSPKVLLLRLSERVSKNGRKYYSRWLGLSKVVVFEATEADKYGNPQLEVFVSTPEPKSETGA